MPRDIQEVSASVGMTRGKFEKRRIVSNWNKSVNCGSLKGSQVKEMNLMAGLWLMSFRSWNIRICEPDEFNQMCLTLTSRNWSMILKLFWY